MTDLDPIARFQELFAEARASEPADATAAALATADGDGNPSVRMVLVKGVDSAGFRFFTNMGSRKARELAVNPRAALCFHWPAVGRQVRVEGDVSRLSDAESDAYFATRPRDSQLGAWASRQSDVLGSRAELIDRLAEMTARHGSGPVPRPPFWAGFLLAPRVVEVWSAREHRLHERERYTLDGDVWTREWLYP
jgi:pyridoxamine 5'-phosphate oxidase